MEMNTEGNAERFFKEFGRKLDQFMIELKDAGNRVEADLRNKFVELKMAADKLNAEAENKKRWKEVEESLKKAGREMENAFREVFKKKV